jgi:hypothetical protein
MAKTLGCLHVIAKDLVRSWTSPNEICYIKTSSGNRIFLVLRILPVSIILPTLHTQIFFLQCSKQEKQTKPSKFQTKLSAVCYVVDHGSSTYV